MSKPIPAINRYKADLREFTFLLFEQFGIDKPGQAPFDAWGWTSARPRSRPRTAGAAR